MDNNEGNSEEVDFYGGVEHRNGGTDDNGNARRPVKNFEDLMEAMDEDDTAARRKHAARNDNIMDRVTVHIKDRLHLCKLKGSVRVRDLVACSLCTRQPTGRGKRSSLQYFQSCSSSFLAATGDGSTFP
jgi:hypothetical protein